MAGDDSENQNKPSTSKSFSFFDKNQQFVDVVNAALIFEKLAIDCDSEKSSEMCKSQKKILSPKKNLQMFQVPIYKQNRHRPYFVPINVKWRRSRCVRISPFSYDMDELSRIILKGDVEPLKLCLFDRKELITPCSVQAARPPSPDEDIDELSEYFAHFVRVELKMSALAESMYV